MVRATRLIPVFAVIVVLNGCQHSVGGITEFPITERSVSLHVQAVDPSDETTSGDIEGAVPVEVAVRMSNSFKDGDPHNDSVILKAELNFGDGSGWVDCTADSQTKWYEEPAEGPFNSPDWMTRHIYLVPGTYEIDGRFTFWDGEVHYAEYKSNATIKVLSGAKN